MTDIIILLAACNGAAYLEAQLDSILAQSADSWQLILSDDGSTDGTPEILRTYAAENPGRISLYESGRRFGSPQAHFLHLIGEFAGKADYLMLSDQDDVWHPDKIARTLQLMKKTEEAAPGPVLVHTDVRVCDAELREIHPSLLRMSGLAGGTVDFNHLLIENFVTGHTCMLNRELALECRDHMPSRLPAMHDWWLALIAARLGTIALLPEATADYRQHGRNSVGAESLLPLLFRRLTRVRETRGRIRRAMEQAELFGACFSCPEAQGFGELGKAGKLERIRFVREHQIWKQTPSRILGMIGEIIFI